MATETWVLNNLIVDDNDYLVFQANFVSNGADYDEIEIHRGSGALPSGYDLSYINDGNYVLVYQYYEGEGYWYNQAYRTIVLEEPASGNLLTWLETYAVKQVATDADYLIKESTLTGIANAIRAKTGSAASLSPANMENAIENDLVKPSGNKAITAGTSTQTDIDVKDYATVSVAPTPTEERTATQNGEVTPTSGKFLSKVTVNVPSTPPTLIPKTVTANGTYNASADNADGYSQVTVAIPTYDGTVV